MHGILSPAERRRLLDDARSKKGDTGPREGFGALRWKYHSLARGLNCPIKEVRRTIMRVLWKHNIAWALVLSPRRQVSLAAARQECAWSIATAFPEWSYPRIGRMLRRDHSTIVHSVQKVSGEVLQGRVQPVKNHVIPIPRRQYGFHTKGDRAERDARVLAKYDDGMGALYIAKVLGLPYPTVYNIIFRALGERPHPEGRQ